MTHKRYQHPTIELCRDCKGIGRIAEHDRMDILQMNEPEIAICPTCEGCGRVMVAKETTITVTPFEQEANHRLVVRYKKEIS